MPITVRDMIRRHEKDGWRQVGQSGNHRQFKHPTKPGRVTVPGHLGGRSHALNRIEYQAPGRLEVTNEYLVIYEEGPRNWSAYVPDLPGCVSTGKTREDCGRNMREAIELHLRGMIEDGDPIPKPTSQAGLFKVAA